MRYFGLGGTSVYIGDGALSYAGEKVLEAYYKYGFGDGIDATLDYQLLVNPAHNSARGPINVVRPAPARGLLTSRTEWPRACETLL